MDDWEERDLRHQLLGDRLFKEPLDCDSEGPEHLEDYPQPHLHRRPQPAHLEQLLHLERQKERFEYEAQLLLLREEEAVERRRELLRLALQTLPEVEEPPVVGDELLEEAPL